METVGRNSRHTPSGQTREVMRPLLNLHSPLFCSFMRQVQDETLRLSTLGPFAARYSDEEVMVCGYHIPAKTPIITALGVALKNTTQWEDEEK